MCIRWVMIGGCVCRLQTNSRIGYRGMAAASLAESGACVFAAAHHSWLIELTSENARNLFRGTQDRTRVEAWGSCTCCAARANTLSRMHADTGCCSALPCTALHCSALLCTVLHRSYPRSTEAPPSSLKRCQRCHRDLCSLF